MALILKLLVIISLAFGHCDAFLFNNPVSIVTNLLRSEWLHDLVGLDPEQKERVNSALNWVSRNTFGYHWKKQVYHSMMDHYTSMYEGQKAQIADYCTSICDPRNCLNKKEEESVLQKVLRCKEARYSENGQDGSCKAGEDYVIEWYRVEGFIEVENVWRYNCPEGWRQDVETKAFCMEECSLKGKTEL